jgi:alpha-beta hydrolase superfamily lysophospholipase
LPATYRAAESAGSIVALLIHGIGVGRHENGFYTRMADRLAQGGTPSLRFDWRSQGESSLPTRDLTLFGIVNDVDAAHSKLRELSDSSGPLVVVAASFGGGVAARWAASLPDSPRHVILLAPVLDYNYDLFRGRDSDPTGKLSDIAAGRLVADGHLRCGDLDAGWSCRKSKNCLLQRSCPMSAFCRLLGSIFPAMPSHGV